MSYLYDQLWIKIDSFKIDDEKSIVKFSDKLAKENNWSLAFAFSTINEYKRFVYLCCSTPTGASPSDIVDKVWHLHLTYTMNYWKDFCPNILGRELHHFPSKGGVDEKTKHINWYEETIELYIKTFGEIPPSNIWTIPEKYQLKNENKQNLNLVYAQNSFGISKAILPEIIAFIVPALYLTFLLNNINPFKLDGEQFLGFFLILGISFLALAIYKSIQFRKNYSALIKDQIPKDLTVFDLAYMKNGQQNLIQTAILDLIENKAIYHKGKGEFEINSENAFNTSKKYNPISKSMAEYEKHSIIEYKDFAEASTDAINEIDLKLKSIEDKILVDNNVQYLFYILGILGISRVIQGISNGKHVLYLLVLLFIFAIAAYYIYKFGNKDFVFKEIAEDMYRNSHQNDVTIFYSSSLLDQFIWIGCSCLKGRHAYNELNYFFERKSKKKESSCSSCSSGGCGSSCSSGGDGGGDGCGGCGGGD